jgi:CRISPR-associated protein Csm3
MSELIRYHIKTLSNLFIGGAPAPFEIGGLDQSTVCDPDGFPYIPGSSIKGTLRALAERDESPEGERIKELYSAYLKRIRERDAKPIEEIEKEKEALERIKERFEKAIEDASAAYLFGIKGFNDTPRLFFGDLLLCKEDRKQANCFSVDMKNTIVYKDDKPVSNPRSYKTARSGLVFEGEIRLYKMESLGENAAELCRSYIIDTLLKLNGGFHRLGNSKSRGYGRVEAKTFEPCAGDRA